MKKVRILLEKYLEDEIKETQIALLELYLDELLKWNRVYNLTAITNIEEMVIKHVLDSLSIKNHLKGERILDVGTGAGLPGIPLAIVFPDKHVTLLDSNSKKTCFLLHVVGKLQLKNVEVVHHRIETYQPSSCFSTIVTRAFSHIADFLDKTQHLICDGGIFLAMKGIYPKEELAQLSEDFKVKEVVSLQVPDLDAERHLVVLIHS